MGVPSRFNAAREYGETLSGPRALSYIIRLDHAGASGPDQMIHASHRSLLAVAAR
jgi:hypothetical protein